MGRAESAGEKAVGALVVGSGVAAADHARAALEVVEAGRDGLLVGGDERF